MKRIHIYFVLALFLSAWYIFGALGFYPVCSGSGLYDLGMPSVRQATILLRNGEKLTIRVRGTMGPESIPEKVLYNGEELKTHQISHRRLMQGGLLLFVTGRQPARRPRQEKKE